MYNPSHADIFGAVRADICTGKYDIRVIWERDVCLAPFVVVISLISGSGEEYAGTWDFPN